MKIEIRQKCPGCGQLLGGVTEVEARAVGEVFAAFVSETDMVAHAQASSGDDCWSLEVRVEMTVVAL